MSSWFWGILTWLDLSSILDWSCLIFVFCFESWDAWLSSKEIWRLYSNLSYSDLNYLTSSIFCYWRVSRAKILRFWSWISALSSAQPSESVSKNPSKKKYLTSLSQWSKTFLFLFLVFLLLSWALFLSAFFLFFSSSISLSRSLSFSASLFSRISSPALISPSLSHRGPANSVWRVVYRSFYPWNGSYWGGIWVIWFELDLECSSWLRWSIFCSTFNLGPEIIR